MSVAHNIWASVGVYYCSTCTLLNHWTNETQDGCTGRNCLESGIVGCTYAEDIHIAKIHNANYKCRFSLTIFDARMQVRAWRRMLTQLRKIFIRSTDATTIHAAIPSRGQFAWWLVNCCVCVWSLAVSGVVLLAILFQATSCWLGGSTWVIAMYASVSDRFSYCSFSTTVISARLAS